MTAAGTEPLLAADEWRAREAAHHNRVDIWLAPRLARRRVGAKDAVDDFLFDYYPLRPSRLRAWHPGLGPVLADAGDRGRCYRAVPGGVQIDPAGLGRRLPQLLRNLAVLRATTSRPPAFGCFGLHEWAMVYGQRQDQVRHTYVPLRVAPKIVQDTVDTLGLRCTHFDAYRFFTPVAAARQLPLHRAGQIDDEQPACLHAGMDLYRYAYQASPFVPSELVADCFAHARAAREVDMRASPYDLSDRGLAPIPVETTAGRREYVAAQQRLAESAAPLRDRVVTALTELTELTARAPTGAHRGSRRRGRLTERPPVRS